MGDLDLSAPPLALKLDVSRDCDFVRVMEPVDGATFPAGAAILLDFGNPSGEPGGEVVWAAVVTPTAATWQVDKMAVNALIDAWGRSNRRPCALRYSAGNTDLVWARTPRVTVHGP